MEAQRFVAQALIEEIARGDQRFALGLANDPFWAERYPWASMTGVATAAGPGADWLSLRNEFLEIARERVEASTPADKLERQITSNLAHVDQLLANGWARHDLGAAVDFYVNDSHGTGLNVKPSALALAILQSVPAAQRWDVVDWYSDIQGSNEWADEVVVGYAHWLRHHPHDEVITQLVTIPAEEAQRVRILEELVLPKESRGKMVLPRAQEEVFRLIDAANLAPETRASLVSRIEGAIATGS